MQNDTPKQGKVYALTGATGDRCIANGNTWKDSEVKTGMSQVDALGYAANALKKEGIQLHLDMLHETSPAKRARLATLETAYETIKGMFRELGGK